MHLEGVLFQAGSPTGTVALVATDRTVLAVTATASNGYFELAVAVIPVDATLYGFPGESLNADQVPAWLEKPAGTIYQAPVPATEPGEEAEMVYINLASTCVCAALKRQPALTARQASEQLKPRLFGSGVARFMPGYPAEFLVQIARPATFSTQRFAAAVESAGGLDAWVAQPTPAGSAELPFADPAARRADAGRSRKKKKKKKKQPSAPTVAPSANWTAEAENKVWQQEVAAVDDTGNLGDCMDSAAATTDGIAASVTDSAFSSSISDFAKWAGENLAEDLLSALAGQMFTMVSSWLFGGNGNPVATALTQISQQIADSIENQKTIAAGIAQILTEVRLLAVQTALDTINGDVGRVHANLKRIHEYAQTTTGKSSSALQQRANDILDPDVGVLEALISIQQIVEGAPGTPSLPNLVLTSMLNAGGVGPGVGQNFLSNANCFTFVQSLYTYLAHVQMEAVRLIVIAHNFNANASVSDPSTALTVNARALNCYNENLIGGAGNTADTPTTPPHLQRQRDAFRTLFWPYYHNAQGFLSPLPDDLAVGLLPHVSNQSFSIFFNSDTNLFVLGHLSGKLRTWTSGTGVPGVNSALIGTPWTLPAGPAWRYPWGAELGSMFAPTANFPAYQSDLFQYLYDEGFTNDAADYPSGYQFTSLFILDRAFYGEAWLGESDVLDVPPTFPLSPSDIDGNMAQVVTLPQNWGYSYWFSGFWPMAYLNAFNNGWTKFISSQCYNIYDPSDPSSSSSDLAWLQVSGGLVVADPVGYLPFGSYAENCMEIKVTLSCNAQKNDGTTVAVTFDLTPHANIGLANTDGVLSVINPYAPPIVGGLPAFTAGERINFVPPGSYLNNCTDIQVNVSCQAFNGNGYVPASFDLTSYSINGLTLTNTNGVLTS